MTFKYGSKAMKQIRRVSCLLLVLAVLSMLLGTGFVAKGAYADEPMQPEGNDTSVGSAMGAQRLNPQGDPIFVWVGETQVTEANKDDVLNDGGSVKYDTATQTLTLTNANITTSSAFTSPLYGEVRAGILCNGGSGLTIKLAGDNIINSTDIGICASFDSDASGATLTIQGTGSLTATGMAKEGIYVWPGNIDIGGGTLNISATGKGDNPGPDLYGICAHTGTVTIAGGNVTSFGTGGGIAGFKGVKINGGTVTAQASSGDDCPISIIKGDSLGADEGIIIADTHEVTTPKYGRVTTDRKAIEYPNENYGGNYRMATGTVVVESKKLYNISIAETTGGTVTTDPQTAHHGDEVTVSAEPATGLKKLTVVDDSGKTVTVTDQSTFTMPADNVTAYAWFSDPTVTVDFGEGHESFVAKHYGNTAGFTVSGSTVTYTVEAGQTLADARDVILKNGGDMPYDIQPADRLDHGEYFMEENFALKTIDGYQDLSELREELVGYENRYASAAGTTFHALWEKPAGSVVATVVPLLCGTNVSAERAPVSSLVLMCSNPTVPVTLTDDSKAELDSPYLNNWLQTRDGEVSEFTAVGGTNYYASFELKAPFGYYLNKPGENVSVTNGTEVTVTDTSNPPSTECAHSVKVVVTVPAEHAWGDGVIDPKPTCTTTGTKTSKCTNCGETKTEDVDPLGHDWDVPTYVWADDNSSVTATRVCTRDETHTETETAKTTSSVTKEPTTTEPGERLYVATFENEAFETQTKTEEIPPTSAVEYLFASGDKSTWTKGSDTSATFTVKRSEDNDTAFAHFTSISVDNTQVSADQYTAESGSVVIGIKPAYLETLSTGDHTLTAEFDDGSASATFTVKAKDSSKSADDTKDGTSSGSTGGSTSGTAGSTSGTTGTATKTTQSSTATPKTADQSSAAPAALLAAAAVACLLARKRA